MDNSHISNSDPKLTPGWRPYPFERTSLLTAIGTTQSKGPTTHRFIGSVPPDWCSSSGKKPSAHGGYCVSVLLGVAIQHSLNEDAARGHIVPLSISVEFLAPLPQGEYHVEVSDYCTSRTMTTMRAEIIDPHLNKAKTYCVALIRLRVADLDGGHKAIENKLTGIPNRLRDCARWTSALYYYSSPPTSTLRLFTPKGRGHPFWSENFGGQSTRWQWTKLDDEQRFCFLHLPVLADLIPAIPLNYERNIIQAALAHEIVTVSLRVDFRVPRLDEEWLVSRTTTKKLHDGLFDMEVAILNEQGNLVATSTQTWSMVPRREAVQINSTKTRL